MSKADELINKAVAVLQEHILPQSRLTDAAAISRMYAIFDGPEYRAYLNEKHEPDAAERFFADAPRPPGHPASLPHAAAEPEKPVAKLLERSELPATLGLWLDEQGNYYRLAETPLYASPAEPKGPMNDAEQMLCDSIMDRHVTAGPVSVIPVRAAVRAAYQAGKAAVQQPERNKMEILAARLTAPPFCETCRDMREEVAGQLYDVGD